jgi:hypothetical protein
MNIEPLNPQRSLTMAKAKKRRAKKRRPVNTTERVAATPETLAKLKPWPMQDLLRRGPENGGISNQQFEASLLIVEAFCVITRGLGFKPLDLARIGHGSGELSSRQTRLWSIYVSWGNEFQRRFLLPPHVVVEWVEDSRPIYPASVAMLAKAADLWDRMAGDHDKRRAVERHEIAA